VDILFIAVSMLLTVFYGTNISKIILKTIFVMKISSEGYNREKNKKLSFIVNLFYVLFTAGILFFVTR
jgi:hypothetical protein